MWKQHGPTHNACFESDKLWWTASLQVLFGADRIRSQRVRVSRTTPKWFSGVCSEHRTNGTLRDAKREPKSPMSGRA